MDKFNLREYLKNNPLLKEDVSSRFIQKYLSEFNAEDFEIEDIESYSDRDKAIFAYLEIGPGIIVKDEVAKAIKGKSGEERIEVNARGKPVRIINDKFPIINTSTFNVDFLYTKRRNIE